jgi:hypothetical protein
MLTSIIRPGSESSPPAAISVSVLGSVQSTVLKSFIAQHPCFIKKIDEEVSHTLIYYLYTDDYQMLPLKFNPLVMKMVFQ